MFKTLVCNMLLLPLLLPDNSYLSFLYGLSFKVLMNALIQCRLSHTFAIKKHVILFKLTFLGNYYNAHENMIMYII